MCTGVSYTSGRLCAPCWNTTWALGRSCQALRAFNSHLVFLHSVPLLRCHTLVMGCSIRMAGSLYSAPTAAGPGTCWSMPGSSIMLPRVILVLHERGSGRLPGSCLLSCTNVHGLFARALCTQRCSRPACSLEWLSSSGSMAGRKANLDVIVWISLFAAAESFCALFLGVVGTPTMPLKNATFLHAAWPRAWTCP